MIIITDEPNHPAITSHKRPGIIYAMDGKIIHFDEILFFEENAEWPDEEPPFYYYWNKADNFRCGISVANVRFIYFKDDRISKASK